MKPTATFSLLGEFVLLSPTEHKSGCYTENKKNKKKAGVGFTV